LPINSDYLGNSNQESNQENVAKTEQERSIFLLRYCFEPRTKIDMLRELGLSNQSVNFRRHIQPLLERGLIERTIPDKPRNRNQKYITTLAGRKFIDNL